MRKVFDLHGVLSVLGLEKTSKGLKNLDTKLKNVSKQLAKTGKQFEKLGTSFTKNVTVPIVAAGVAIAKTVELASDLAETTSKVGMIFGKSAKDIEEWSKTTARAMGQSRNMAMDAAATFAIYGQKAGLAGKELVDFSTKFVGLASDMASFSNTKPEDAIVAVGSALRKEYEPIRKYGVMLDEATARQKAFEMGIVDTTKKALTPQQSTLAVTALIYEQTSLIQGDFARTSDQLANTQRIVQARFQDAAAKIGTVFLPVALRVARFIDSNLIPKVEKLALWLGKLDQGFIKNALKLAAFAAVTGPVLLAIGKITTAVSALRATVLLLNASILTNPFTIAAATVALFGVAIYATTKKYQELQKEHLKFAMMTEEQASKKEFVKGYDALLKKMSAFAASGKKEDEILKLMTKDINKLTMSARELKYEIKGTVTERATAIAQIANEIKEVRNIRGEVVKYTGAIKKTSEVKKRLTEEELKALEKVREQQREMMTQGEKEQALFIKIQEDNNKKVMDGRKSWLDNFLSTSQLMRDEKAKTEKEDSDALELQKQQRRNIADFAISSAQEVFNTFQMFRQNKMMAIENDHTREQENIEALKISEEEKEEKLKELDEKTAARKRKEMRKAAILEKAQAIFSIGISTAQAIMKAWASLPPYVAAVMSFVIGGIATAQTALVASKPLPLKDGALIKGGSGGIVANIGEAQDDELVLPMKAGVMSFVDAFISKITELSTKSLFLPSPSVSYADSSGGGGGGVVNVHNHIGTLIADDHGMKEFERRQRNFRYQDAQRNGAV